MIKTLDYVLGILDGVAQVATLAGGPAIAPIAGLSEYFIRIAKAAADAHLAATGKALDLSKLKDIDTV